MKKLNIPSGGEQITPEWLTEALSQSGVIKDNAVRSLNYQIIGEGQGFIATLTRLFIEYEKPDDSLPKVMIAKIPNEEMKIKLLMEAFWNLERENRLYEEILHQLPLRTPRCYYSDFDRREDEKWMAKVYQRYGSLPKSLMPFYLIYVGWRNYRLKKRYILLLEDFGNLEQFSHVEGCSVEDAKKVIKTLGLSQAKTWESSLLNKYWLKNDSDISNMMGFLSDRWQSFVKKTFPGKISRKAQATLDWLKKNNNKLDAYCKNRPHTLLHTDLRLDNIFFDRINNEIAVIDWQAPTKGMGIFDAAFFLLNNCTSPLSQEQVKESITIYHQGLVEGGVSDYSLDECLSDYPYGLLLAVRYWLIIIGGLGDEKKTDAIKLMDVVLDRMMPQIESIELGALNL